MHDVTYTDSLGRAWPFRGAGVDQGDVDSLWSHEWEAELGGLRVTSKVRRARSVKVALFLRDMALADDMLEAFDRDVALGLPGSLEVDGWSRPALVLSAESEIMGGDAALITLGVALLERTWSKSHSSHVAPSSDLPVGADLDYPHGWPHDWRPVGASAAIEVEAPSPCPVRLTVYGPADSPAVTLAGNRYAVDVDVPAGARLVVDGLKRTIVLHRADGTAANCFAAGERGGGEGSGAYIFEQVPPGPHRAQWDSTFSFDFEWFEQAGEPRWTR